MVAVGGIFGSLLGGYLTEIGVESYCFLARALVGFAIAFSAFSMDSSLEAESESFVNSSFI